MEYWFVAHTHWDREWYLAFQDFRWKLVKAVDRIIDTLRSDGSFTHFMLDGQTIVLEDYAELRPERRGEVVALVGAGRLSVGPWYVQPDEILVTGEALIRNLERGLSLARELGGSMMVGYVPDCFGHIGSLPSIFKGFGIDIACLMRGGGPELDKTFFHWESRDGSRVLVSYLIDSYGNGADLPMDGATLRENLSALIQRQKDALLPGMPLLVMNGTDHRSIVSELPSVIEAAGLSGVATIGPLQGYIEKARAVLPAVIPEWKGELRSAWRFPLIVGCTSTRHWIKREDQEVSTLLERDAEPLAALASWAGEAYPFHAIGLAWKYLLRNQPHDSICGCSIDPVHEDMKYRYAQARGLAHNCAADAAAAIAARVDASFAASGATVAVALNPGPARRNALLSFPAAEVPDNPVLLDREGGRHSAQVIVEGGGSSFFFDERFTPRQLTFVMGMVKHGEILTFKVRGAKATWESESILRIDLELADKGFSGFDWDAWAAEAALLLKKPGLKTIHAVGRRSGPMTVLFSADLPAFGARAFTLTARDRTPAGPIDTKGRDALKSWSRGLENGRYRIRVLSDGSLEIRDKKSGIFYHGVNRIVDGGDRGDEYNFDPPLNDHVIDAPRLPFPRIGRVRAGIVEKGELRTTLRIHALYRLPEALAPDRGSRGRKRTDVEIVREVSLAAGSDRIEFRTMIHNTARDHRMRVHFPLPGKADWSEAGGTFEVVRRPARPVEFPADIPGRGLTPEMGEEQPTATHPFTGFVSATVSRAAPGASKGAALAVLGRGLREYELVEGRHGTEIAVTLFRSIGWLSRADLKVRRGNAGPDTPTPAAQEIGKHVFEYACVAFEGSPPHVALFEESENYRIPPRVLLRSFGRGDLPDNGSLISLDDTGLIFSSLRRLPAGGFSLRFHDVLGVERTSTIRFGLPVSAARKTRLDGVQIVPLALSSEGRGASAVFPVRPYEIVTIEFDKGGTAHE